MENRLAVKVTQYTHTMNDRPLKINKYEFVGGGEQWEVIDFGYCAFRAKTAIEVKKFLGKTPKLRGAYEIYETPVGRTIEKQLYGTRVF